ncbi:Lactase/phlorizin hydrolase [Linum grandiflorum]
MDEFSKLSDDLLLKIIFNLQDDPRNWSRLACVSSKFSSIVRNTCCKSKCYSTIPSVVADLLPFDSSSVPGGWSSLYKLAVCCPGLLLSGVLLEHSDFGLHLDLGPEENFPRPSSSSSGPSGLLLQDSSSDANLDVAVADCSWSLFDDLYFDTVYNVDEPSEARPAQEVNDDDDNTATAAADVVVKLGTDAPPPRKRRKMCRSMRSHLATGVWNLSREQGNKLLASRFRGDCLYICDWPGCEHVEEKRKYRLFRGVFKNFKRSRVWRTINDGNRKKIDVNCAFCDCRQTWDLHSAFCLRRVYGFHDDGEPVVRAYQNSDDLRDKSRDRLRLSRLMEGTSWWRLMVLLFLNWLAADVCLAVDEYSRADFPDGFIFGAGTSAYQVEGAADQDGRSPSVWDTFAHAGYVGGATGDVAVDQYHKYKEDVRLMAKMGLDAYRFSISWSRLIPGGRGDVNPKGLKYYNNLINELISHGIQPMVSLYNFDHPQILEDEYGGWVSRRIVEDFRDYAEVCFREFGDRVSHWTTVNEPNILAQASYDQGLTPPRHCSPPFGSTTCDRGNSTTEPYLALHHILLAHGSTVELYRQKYQAKQHGFIGISLYAFGFVPYTNSTADIQATQRAKEFYLGWAAGPLVHGDYPEIMKRNIGSRLPTFTSKESELVKGAFDFLGLIHYMQVQVKDNSKSLNMEVRDFIADMGAQVIYVTPWALQDILEDFKLLYGNPPLYIHENGQVNIRNTSLKDTKRIEYMHAYVGAVLGAIRNGCNLKGYFVWSLLDVFELLSGFQAGFGLYYVDLSDPDLTRHPKLSAYCRADFPDGFVFGAGTSAYQVEGAANVDGRSPSVWDTYAHSGYAGGATGDVAVDQYHKYKEDVELMAEMGLDSYRFSISWSRLIPGGRGAVNPKGIEYYNNLINELISHGIQPQVFLFNYDHPHILEDEYGGWVSPKIVGDFREYAEVCFREFGDRVSHWTTVNEPNIFAAGSYDQGIAPPHRCSPPFGLTACSHGNSSTEPYLVLHHLLLAHASAVQLYRRKYQGKQRGFIGISLYSYGYAPYSNSTQDLLAVQRAKQFTLGWVAEPLVYGDYPEIMKKNVGWRLPRFTREESEMVKGSYDFLGLIHYMQMPIKDDPDSLNLDLRDYNADSATQLMVGLDTYLQGFPVIPGALRDILEDFKQLYGNPPLYIHENGQLNVRNATLKDTERVEFIHAYMGAVLDAIKDGCNVKGYYVWSLLDVFELLGGFKTGFGLYYVDLDDPDLTRYPKLSAHWYSRFLKGATVGSPANIELALDLST